MTCRRLVGAWATLILLGACSKLPDPVPPPEMPALGAPVALPDDPYRLFDFWLGTWNVQNKELQRGSWNDTGTAVALVQPVVDGQAVLEQWKGTRGGDPRIGFSLRAYDTEAERWVVFLNWHGGSPTGFSEMHGQRNGDRLDQFPPDVTDHLRYGFSLAREESCQWDESRSENGTDWVTIWVMQFTRQQSALPVDADSAPIVSPADSASKPDAIRALDFLIGAWSGEVRVLEDDGSWSAHVARARVTSMLEGMGLLQFLDGSDGEKTVAAMGWDSAVEDWVAVRADNRADGLRRLEGKSGPETTVAFSSPTLRETWSCPEADSCTWHRELLKEGEWTKVREASFSRLASTSAWVDIRNARAPFPDILTGGQPTVEQLEEAARHGYRTIVNMRGAGEKGELADEAALVEGLGMRYVHLPIPDRSALTTETASVLRETLSESGALPAIVHCASGNRIGTIFAIEAHEMDGMPAEEALALGRSAGMTSLEPVLRERFGLPAASAD